MQYGIVNTILYVVHPGWKALLTASLMSGCKKIVSRTLLHYRNSRPTSRLSIRYSKYPLIFSLSIRSGDWLYVASPDTASAYASCVFGANLLSFISLIILSRNLLIMPPPFKKVVITTAHYEWPYGDILCVKQ